LIKSIIKKFLKFRIRNLKTRISHQPYDSINIDLSCLYDDPIRKEDSIHIQTRRDIDRI